MMSNRPPDTVETAAQFLTDHFRAHIVALMAYGSRVCGHARTGSAFDFWLIVDDVEKFHHDNAEFYRAEINVPSTPEKQIALNRSGPNFYALKPDGVEIKFAVAGETDFVALCRDEWWTVKGRMQKPLKIICSTPAVDAAILAARHEGLRCALDLVKAEFTLDDLLHALVSLSYRAEVRPEHKAAKIRSIIEVGGDDLKKIYVPLLTELPHVQARGARYFDTRPEADRKRGRVETLRALRRSKWCLRSIKYVWRNFRSHRSPIRYFCRKVVGEFEKAILRRSTRPS